MKIPVIVDMISREPRDIRYGYIEIGLRESFICSRRQDMQR